MIRLVASGDANSLINTGTLDASGQGGDGGTIKIYADDIAQVSGDSLVDVSSDSGDGGTVHVLGERVGLTDSSAIIASGSAGGGEVLIGGDLRGQNPDIKNAQMTFVGPDVTINADATSNGDGGKIIAWADDTTRFHGTATALGGQQSGDGGLIETSGKRSLDVSGSWTDASAFNGEAGTWLIDPISVTITTVATSGGTFGGANPDIFTPGSTGVLIQNTDIENRLNGVVGAGGGSGTNVTITTATAAGTETEAGDVTQAAGATISHTAATNVTLRIDAAGDITISEAITSTTGTLGVDLNANDQGANQNDQNTAAGDVIINAAIDTNGGNFEADGVNVAINDDIDTGAGTFDATADQSITFTGANLVSSSGDITLVANTGGATSGDFTGIHIVSTSSITSDTGAISIDGTAGDASTNKVGVLIDGSVTSNQAAASAITIDGNMGGVTGDSTGVQIGTTGTVTSNEGDISITGDTGSGSSGEGGVAVFGELSSSGTGAGAATIDITGTGDTGTTGLIGVIINGASANITSVDGDITITGDGADNTGANNSGISINGATMAGGGISSTGTGVNAATITVDGATNSTNSSGSSRGVVITNSGIETADGDITIIGDASSNTANASHEGVRLEAGGGSTTIIASGTAAIDITGSGGNTSEGIVLDGGSSITANTGDVDLTVDTTELGSVSGVAFDLSGDVTTGATLTLDSQEAVEQKDKTNTIMALNLDLLGPAAYTLDSAANAVTNLTATISSNANLIFKNNAALNVGATNISTDGGGINLTATSFNDMGNNIESFDATNGLLDSGTISITSTTGDITLTGLVDAGGATRVGDGDGLDAGDINITSAGNVNASTSTIDAFGGDGDDSNADADNAGGLGCIVTISAADSVSVNTIDVAGGDADDQGGATAGAAGGASGDITITSNSDDDVTTAEGISLFGLLDAAGGAGVNAGGAGTDGSVVLDAESATAGRGGAIDDQDTTNLNVSAASLLIESVSGVGVTDVLETDVDSLDVSNTTSGNVEIENDFTVSLVNNFDNQGGNLDLVTLDGSIDTGTAIVTSNGGSITLKAVDGSGDAATPETLTVGAGGIASSGGLITLQAGDDVIISGNVNATGGDVVIQADNMAADTFSDTEGAITTTAGTVTGNKVTLLAEEGIGTGANRIMTSASSLVVDNGVQAGTAGGIFITNAIGVTFDTTFRNQFTGGAGVIDLEVTDGGINTGAVAVSTAGTGSILLVANDASADDSTPANIIIGAGGVSTDGGSITVHAADDVTIGSAIDTNSGGGGPSTVEIIADDGTLEGFADDNGAIAGAGQTATGTTVTLEAAEGIALSTAATTLDASNTVSGDIVIVESNDVDVNDLSNTAAGGIDLSTTAGSITIVNAQNGVSTGTGTVALNAGGAGNLSVNEDVSGGSIDFDAGGSISVLAGERVVGGGAGTSITFDSLGISLGNGGSNTTETVTNSGTGTITLTSTGANDISLGDFAIGGGTGQVIVDSGQDITAPAIGTVEIDAGNVKLIAARSVGTVAGNAIELSGTPSLALTWLMTFLSSVTVRH